MTVKSKRDAQDIERARGQEDQILSMLREAGNRGCTNSQLWAICHAVNSRISDLRKRGHKIDATAEGGGVWRYRLITPQLNRVSDWQDRPRTTGLPLFDAGGRR
jgi:hypothetical protein